MKINFKTAWPSLKANWPELVTAAKTDLLNWYHETVPNLNDLKEQFRMGGNHKAPGADLIQIFGLVALVTVWAAVTHIKFDHDGKDKLLVPTSILPKPEQVLGCYKDLRAQHLFYGDSLMTVDHERVKASTFDRVFNSELAFSLKINFMGYMKAIGWSLLLGYIAGLFGIFRNLSGKWLDAIRYVPLTAITGLFIAWYGIYNEMKINFLSFGIFVYLMPIVVERIDQTQRIYLDTAYTLGASKWQTLRHVYFPSVLGRVFSDIRVITAIGWTYIIVAEMVNQEGGVGSMIYTAARQSHIERVFALLFVIIIVGFVQDIIFRLLDRLFFPENYAQSK
jgi:ABC-type nitrate/sulfonate/bicarbonate transport system permease component